MSITCNCHSEAILGMTLKRLTMATPVLPDWPVNRNQQNVIGEHVSLQTGKCPCIQNSVCVVTSHKLSFSPSHYRMGSLVDKFGKEMSR